MPPDYCLDWCAGGSAQMEIFSPADNAGGYQLKYTPVFRGTMRPPVQWLRPQPNDLIDLEGRLVQILHAAKGRFGGPAIAAPAIAEPPLRSELKALGSLLFAIMLPRYVQTDLRIAGRFLDIGMDERLLHFPWELLYDGTEFLCLTHQVGRFVNALSNPALQIGAEGNDLWDTRTARPLKMLLVVSDNPQPRSSGQSFDDLPGARSEAQAIIDSIGSRVEIKILRGRDATKNNVLQQLMDRHDILHYCGHVAFNDATPDMSHLVLYDDDLSTSMLAPLVALNPPVLAFVNGCESANVTNKTGLSVFGIARVFLDVGTYFLGSRAKVGDDAACVFGAAFYHCLLATNESLGEAVRRARIDSRNIGGDDFGWASYVLYGDPRLVIKPQVSRAPVVQLDGG